MPREILLKDGVRYRLWTPENEPNDFESMIKYHIKDIFGDNCEYFPKRKLKTLAGNRAIPDGFVIDFENQKWYIVELKLLCDDAIRRIAGQIVQYKNAVGNPRTIRDIYKSIKSIRDDGFLDDLINDMKPEIVVIIDSLDGKLGEQFKEQVEGTDRGIRIIEFKTFAREHVDPKMVHIHLFEPISNKTTIKRESYLAHSLGPTRKNKYGLLTEYLANSQNQIESLTLKEIEGIIETQLPESAYIHRAWWSNTGHTHAETWTNAGWKVDSVKLGESVTFNRENKLDDVTTTKKYTEIHPNDKIETKLTPSDIDFGCIRFSVEYRHLFPSHSQDFILETDIGEITTGVSGADEKEKQKKGMALAGTWFAKGIRKWYNAHPELKPYDKIIIEIIEPKKRYKLRIPPK